LVATVRIGTVINPWPATLTPPQSSRLEKVLERQRRTTLAIYTRLTGISAGASIHKPKRFLASSTVWSILVNNATPIDVLQVTILAAANETDRRHPPLLAIISTVFEPLGRLQLLKTYHAAAIRRIASDGIANEPQRKNARCNFGVSSESITTVNRGCTKLRIASCRQPVIILQPQSQQTRKTGLFNKLERPAPLVPMIQSHNEN
jgi:hypothetical protein